MTELKQFLPPVKNVLTIKYPKYVTQLLHHHTLLLDSTCFVYLCSWCW